MLGRSLRIWVNLMVRDIRSRRGQSRFGFLLNIIEPICQLTIVYLVFLYLKRRPDFGQSLFVFLLSGIVPYFLFSHCVSRIMACLRITQSLRMLRVVSVVDVAIASLMVETLSMILAMAALFGACWAIGLPDALPRDPLAMVLATLTIVFSAFGVGLINACLVHFFIAWRMIWSLIQRSLLFFSTVFYLLQNLPENITTWLEWNPLLHGVIWFRIGIFGDFPRYGLDVSYLLAFSGMAALVGLSLERLVRRHA